MLNPKPSPASAPAETRRNLLALMVAHCAGMMDLVALPVWVGTLAGRYQFDPQQAGGLVTLFLSGTALASVLFAARFTRHTPVRMVTGGFGIAALLFLIASQFASFEVLALLHLLGGIASGLALTFTHGTIGHGARPHRTFAFANLAIGIFGIAVLGGAPPLIEAFGRNTLFFIFAAVMATACVTGLLFFPRTTRRIAADEAERTNAHLQPLGRAVWGVVIGVALMCTVQAMTISFVERIGVARGFGREAVMTALIIFGIVTVFPGPLAGLLEKRLSATAVISCVPALQAVFALLITHTSQYGVYVGATAMMPFAMIFTHTFAFGLLARLDPSGRAAAGTPAMIMTGAAAGPFISGTLVKFIGFEAIGYAVVVLVAIELWLFNQTRRAVGRSLH